MAMIERPSLKGFGSDEAVGLAGGCLEFFFWRVIGWFLFLCLSFLLFVRVFFLRFVKDLKTKKPIAGSFLGLGRPTGIRGGHF